MNIHEYFKVNAFIQKKENWMLLFKKKTASVVLKSLIYVLYQQRIFLAGESPCYFAIWKVFLIKSTSVLTIK